MPTDKQIVVIYHKRCPDGFGAAYAAWKKFGDRAHYLPLGYGDATPEGLAGKEVYILDFAIEAPGAMEKLVREAKHVVALDHHESSRRITETAPEYVYDLNRSGATIAWSYFHPDAPLPRLMSYLEDGDLFRFALPETLDVYIYIIVQPEDFATWDEIAQKLDDDAERSRFLEKAHSYEEYFEKLTDIAVEAAKKVHFEGYECYFTNSLPLITMRSHIASKLYKRLPPIALVVSAHPDGFGVSIRGDDTVDVSKIAMKYGGGGHPGSAGFFIPYGTKLPWTEIGD